MNRIALTLVCVAGLVLAGCDSKIFSMEESRGGTRSSRGPMLSSPAQIDADFSPYQEWRPAEKTNGSQSNPSEVTLPQDFWLGTSCRFTDSKVSCWSLASGHPVDVSADIRKQVTSYLKKESDSSRIVLVGFDPGKGKVLGARAVMTTKFSRRAAMEVIKQDEETGLTYFLARPNAGESAPRFSMVEASVKPKVVGVRGRIPYPKSDKPIGDAFKSISQLELPRNSELPASKSIHLEIALADSTKGMAIRDLSQFISVVDAGGNKLPIGFHTTKEGAMITINREGYRKMTEIRFESKDPGHFRLGGYLFFTHQRFPDRV